MIDATQFLGLPPGAGPAPGGKSSLGGDEFMSLLITQLRHQDPLSPLEPHEFAAQLASFTNVEQLTQINQGMDYQLQSLQLSIAMSKTSFSAALLGKNVLAEGDQVAVRAGEVSSVTVDVGKGGGEGTLKIYDDAGKVVATRELGTVPEGRQQVELPDDLPEGVYTYKLEVENAEGAAVGVISYVSGTVDHIAFEDGGIFLKIGEMRLALENLVEISPPAATDSAQA